MTTQLTPAPADGKPPSETPGCSEIDASNPRSIINLLPAWFRERVTAIDTALLEMTEQELDAQLFPGGRSTLEARNDRTFHMLRTGFWHEYDRVQRESLPVMDLIRACENICSVRYFQRNFIVSDLNVAWLLRPPSTYTLTVRECLRLGIERMYEVLQQSAVDKNGKVNEKLADIQHKMFITLDQRVNGAIVQTVNQRNLNVNVDGGNASTQPQMKLSLAEIQSRIAELEAKQRTALPSPEVRPNMLANLQPIEAEVVRVENIPSQPSQGHPEVSPVRRGGDT